MNASDSIALRGFAWLILFLLIASVLCNIVPYIGERIESYPSSSGLIRFSWKYHSRMELIYMITTANTRGSTSAAIWMLSMVTPLLLRMLLSAHTLYTILLREYKNVMMGFILFVSIISFLTWLIDPAVLGNDSSRGFGSYLAMLVDIVLIVTCVKEIRAQK